jgi:hypothetical protein
MLLLYIVQTTEVGEDAYFFEGYYHTSFKEL